jgi:hypothetical protein
MNRHSPGRLSEQWNATKCNANSNAPLITPTQWFAIKCNIETVPFSGFESATECNEMQHENDLFALVQQVAGVCRHGALYIGRIRNELVWHKTNNLKLNSIWLDHRSTQRVDFHHPAAAIYCRVPPQLPLRPELMKMTAMGSPGLLRFALLGPAEIANL